MSAAACNKLVSFTSGFVAVADTDYLSEAVNAFLLLVDEIIEGKGYVLIPEVLNPTQAQEARSLVLQLAEKEKGIF